MLASRLQEKHLLKAGISVLFYRNREEKLRKYFSFDVQLVYCTDVEGFFLLSVCLHIVQMTGDFLLIGRKEASSVSCSIMVTSMYPSL